MMRRNQNACFRRVGDPNARRPTPVTFTSWKRMIGSNDRRTKGLKLFTMRKTLTTTGTWGR